MIITIYYKAKITDKNMTRQMCEIEHTIDDFTFETKNLVYRPIEPLIKNKEIKSCKL